MTAPLLAPTLAFSKNLNFAYHPPDECKRERQWDFWGPRALGDASQLLGVWLSALCANLHQFLYSSIEQTQRSATVTGHLDILKVLRYLQ